MPECIDVSSKIDGKTIWQQLWLSHRASISPLFVNLQGKRQSYAESWTGDLHPQPCSQSLFSWWCKLNAEENIWLRVIFASNGNWRIFPVYQPIVDINTAPFWARRVMPLGLARGIISPKFITSWRYRLSSRAIKLLNRDGWIRHLVSVRRWRMISYCY